MDREELLEKLKLLRKQRLIFIYTDFPDNPPELNDENPTPEGFVRVGIVHGDIYIVPDKERLEEQKFLGYICSVVKTSFDQNPHSLFSSRAYFTHIGLEGNLSYVIFHDDSFLEEKAKEIQEHGERFSLSEIN